MKRKKRKGIYSLLLTLVMLLNVSPFYVNANALAEEPAGSSLNAPAGYQPQAAAMENLFRGFRAMVDGPTVLVIEDVAPWGAVSYRSILQMRGTVEMATSWNVPSMDLSRFDAIILSNDQMTSTYNNYAGFRSALESYVRNGGVLLFGACDQGWNAGDLSADLPGGLRKIHHYEPQNTIADFFHPITANLTDNDLYWGYASHSSFDEDTLPEGSRIILNDTLGRPTLVEYPLGAGTVIASGLTWEHNYEYSGQYAPKALGDLYAYLFFLASGNFMIEISSATVWGDDFVDITVSMKNNPGLAGFSFELIFDNQDGYIRPMSITPGMITELFQSNIGNVTDWSATNIVSAVMANPDDIMEEFADLFTVRFAVSDDIPVGVYPLQLYGMAVNAGYEELEYGLNPGVIRVPDDIEFLYGDVHTDWSVDVKDAVRMLQYFIGTVELSRYERTVANVLWESESEAGRPGAYPETINMLDAICLGRYLAGDSSVILGSVGAS